MRLGSFSLKSRSSWKLGKRGGVLTNILDYTDRRISETTLPTTCSQHADGARVVGVQAKLTVSNQLEEN